MSTPEIIRAMVSLAPPQPSTANKREVTPSFGQSPSQAQPSVTEPVGQGGEKNTRYTRHVLLPYDLRDRNIILAKDEVQALLCTIFPKTENVSEPRYRSHLVFQVDELPPPPRPLTVGGLPITFVGNNIDNDGLLFPRQTLSNYKISVCADVDVATLTGQRLRDLAARVNLEIIKNLPGIRVVELIFTAARTFYVVLADNVNIRSILSKAPGRIVKCPTGYVNVKDLHRPAWANLPARKQIDPSPITGVVDDTAYDTVRPGVMIGSEIPKEHGRPNIFSTTAGVLVKNNENDVFMTVASHGVGRQIWQPHRPERIIGEPMVEIPFTDITLMRLRPDVRFTNETFASSGGVVPRFKGLITPNDPVKFEPIHLNSPFAGHMEGNVVMHSVKIPEMPSGSTDNLKEVSEKYVLCHWHFMGQGDGSSPTIAPPDGTCGSVLWNDDGIVVGFYQYAIRTGEWAGFSAAVRACEVVASGCTLAV